MNRRFPGWGSNQVAILLEYARSKRLSSTLILDGSGVSLEQLSEQDPTLAQELAIIRNLIACTPISPFKLGLEVGLNCKPYTFGLMGETLMSFRNPIAMIRFVSQYFSGDNGEFHFLKIRPQIRRDCILTTFEIPTWLSEKEAAFVLGRDMGATVTWQENVLYGLSKTLEVGFQGPEVTGMSDVGEFYDCPVRYHEPVTYLKTSLNGLESILPLGNQLLEIALPKRLKELLQAPTPELSISARVKTFFESEGYKDISKEQLAHSLNMSTRTLSRHLANEGTSWRALSTKLRMDKARNLLRNSDLSIEQIALKVGFASASAFSNAFSRETSKSPLEYRLELAWDQSLERC